MPNDPDTDFLSRERFDGANPQIFAPMLNWWLSASAQHGRLPTRKDLRPEELPPQCLPHLVIVEILPNAERLRFRLFGGAHVAFSQRDLTGLYLDEAIPSAASVAYLTGLYREMQRVRRPLWSVNQVRHPRTGQQLAVHRLMLPLATNGVDVDLCLGVQTFGNEAVEETGADNAWRHSPEAGERARRFL